MTEKSVLEELEAALANANGARTQLACLVRHLNSGHAKELTKKFVDVLPKEIPNDICVTHLLHASVIMLLESEYKTRGYSRAEWLDEYAVLIQSLLIAVEREGHMKEEKAKEEPGSEKEQATAETN